MSVPRQKVEVLEIPAGQVFINYMLLFVIAGLITWIFSLIWGDMFLVDMANYFSFSWYGVGQVWFVFVIATVGALIAPRIYTYTDKPTLFFRAGWLSLLAGVCEEIIYRWFYFLVAMVMLPFFNFITFGFVEWIYGHLFIPVANFATLGLMSSHLITTNWVLGAALISALASFRDAHSFHSLLGRINAWYMGMLLFWVMFNYGIYTAMVVHVLYDFIILGLRALLAMPQTRYRVSMADLGTWSRRPYWDR